MTDEFKKVGSNLDLKGLVIHQVIKNAGDRLTNAKKAPRLIPIQEKEKLFIGRINKAYYKKSNPIYGIFANEDPTFKNLLSAYLITSDFYAFSVEALAHYKKVLETSPPATGGFVIFAHYTNTDNKNDYMLVLTINNKDGYVVSEADLTLVDIKNLDLSKVDVAGMINLTKWKNIESGVDTESKTYLSFVKGNKDVSYYFLSFIDCDNKTTSSESTTRLITALDEYCREKNYDRDTRIRKRNDVSSYCLECIEHRKEIQLSAISALMDPEDPEGFQLFASSETYSVCPIVYGDKAKLKSIKYIRYSGDNLKIEFDSNLLGKSVIYNPKKKELTIKNLPQTLIDQIPDSYVEKNS